MEFLHPLCIAPRKPRMVDRLRNCVPKEHKMQIIARTSSNFRAYAGFLTLMHENEIGNVHSLTQLSHLSQRTKIRHYSSPISLTTFSALPTLF